ncbi:MAG: class F sortase [Propionibacteriaceae bacterium]|jgi:LPXTG-site transpeptidase (sortase) family protein|nr:class F sortase [Propionibacteriaceae bacterium]
MKPTNGRTGKIVVGIIGGLAVIAIVVALVMALGIHGKEASNDESTPGMGSSTPGATSSSPRPSATPLPATVAKADPQHITIPTIAVDAPIELYTTAMAQSSSNPLTGAPCYADDRIACVNPPEFDRAYWLKAGEGAIPFGDQAGTNSAGTVYLVGHASESVPALFNDLYKLQAGDEIRVTTANGVVKYAVQEVVILDKSDWSSSSYANDQVPGRLIIGTCYHASDAVIGDSGSSTQNVLIVAQTDASSMVVGG